MRFTSKTAVSGALIDRTTRNLNEKTVSGKGNANWIKKISNEEV